MGKGIKAIIPPDDCLDFELYCEAQSIKYEFLSHEMDGMHIRIKPVDLGTYLKFWEYKADAYNQRYAESFGWEGCL